MSRRRRGRRGASDGFGTSLADILTTALGCVLLLFLVAVMHIRSSLNTERDAHAQTQAELSVQAQQRAEAAARRQAAERAAQAASGAAAEAARAARALADRQTAVVAERDALVAERDALQAQVEALAIQQGRLEDALAAAKAVTVRVEQDQAALRDAARAVLTDLDPRTARPVDVMLVIDGTRSMARSLDATRRNLRTTIDALRVVSPTARVGAVVFRDRREAPVLRLEQHPLTADDRALEGFLAGIEATSTGVDDDRPEWLCGGLAAGAQARWRPDAIRLIITTSDAAADGPGAAPCVDTAARFAAEGGRVYVLTNPPPGHRRRAAIRREYRQQVLPQHAAIAEAGRGRHVRSTNADALLGEVLRAAYQARTIDPVERLREVVGE